MLIVVDMFPDSIPDTKKSINTQSGEKIILEIQFMVIT